MDEKMGNQKVQITFSIGDENENETNPSSYDEGYINHGVSLGDENTISPR